MSREMAMDAVIGAREALEKLQRETGIASYRTLYQAIDNELDAIEHYISVEAIEELNMLDD